MLQVTNKDVEIRLDRDGFTSTNSVFASYEFPNYNELTLKVPDSFHFFERQTKKN